MSMMSDIPFIDTTIEPEPTDSEWSGPLLVKLLTDIRPQWRGMPIVCKRFREGICNTVLKCSVGQDEDAVVVRINGDRIKIFPFQYDANRTDELKVYRIFLATGVSPSLLCVFRNGICMEYVRGKQFTWFDTFYKDANDPFIRTNMKELVRYHSKRTSTLAKEMGFEESPAVIKHCRVLLDSMGEKIPDTLDVGRLHDAIGPNFKETLEEELKILVNRCTSLDLPVVFCHGDVNPTNIIHNVAEDKVTYVDYESAGFNYAAYELARHIYLVTCGIHVDIKDRLPSKQFILQVIRVYLEERNLADGCSRTDEDAVQLWYLHVQTAMLFVYYWQTLFSLNWVTNQPMRGIGDEDRNNQFTEDLYWSIISRINQYWRQKDEVLNMAIPK